jgi:hypothetical protein
VSDLHGWTITPWNCVCGRTHAPWWRSTPPPSCPHGWPSQPERALAPPTLQSIVEALDAVAAQGGTRA